MLQLNLSDQQFNCLLRCTLYWRLDGIELVIFKVKSRINIFSISCEIAPMWDLTDDKSTLVQVMAWCHQATWAHVDQDQCHHMASLAHNALTLPCPLVRLIFPRPNMKIDFQTKYFLWKYKLCSRILKVIITSLLHEAHGYIWWVLCQELVSRTYVFIASYKILWDVITYPCPRYLLLAQNSSYKVLVPPYLSYMGMHKQCMKWPVTHSPNSTWFCLELFGNCCERLKIIMKYTNIQFCERLGHGWQFHPLHKSCLEHHWNNVREELEFIIDVRILLNK